MTIKTSGPLSINEINNEWGTGRNLGALRGQIWANPVSLTNGTFTSSGAISFSDFYGRAKRVFINHYVANNSSEQNYVINSSLPGYIAGVTTFTLQVNANAKLGSASTSNPALKIQALTAGDQVNIINYGYIVGAGGAGGDGGGGDPDGINRGSVDSYATAGSNGGNAIKTSFAVTLTNYGNVWGGGGGGGGYQGSATGGKSNGPIPAGGGGGGAGYVAGSGGAGGQGTDYDKNPSARIAGDGAVGTLTAGGASGGDGAWAIGGGDSTSDGTGYGVGGASGYGGDPGQPGGSATAGGGLAGKAIDGVSYVTFANTGDIRGSQV